MTDNFISVSYSLSLFEIRRFVLLFADDECHVLGTLVFKLTFITIDADMSP